MLTKSNNWNIRFIFSELVSIFIIVALFMVPIYWMPSAEAIKTGYADWVAQAFRIKHIQDHGITSWTHTWSNGIDLWRGYQFIPHLISSGISYILSLSITKTMVLITIFLHLFLRVSLYLTLRKYQVARIAAILSTIISLDIAQYWNAISEYSLLWGLAFVPTIIYFWTKSFDHYKLTIFPLLVGLSFYIHALLGVLSVSLFLFEIISNETKVLTRINLGKILIVVLSSSYFWVSLFLSGELKVAGDFHIYGVLDMAINMFGNLGLSTGLISLSLISMLLLVVPNVFIKRWQKSLVVFAFLFLMALNFKDSLSNFSIFRATQFTRMATMLGVIIIISSSFVFNWLLRKRLVIQLITVFLCALMYIDGLWLTNTYSPSSDKKLHDIVSIYTTEYPELRLAANRVWTPTVEISSYLGENNFKTPNSYMEHLEPNLVPTRLNSLFKDQPYKVNIPNSVGETLINYLKVTGTNVVILESVSPYTKLFSESGSFKIYPEITTNNTSYLGYKLIQPVRDAVFTSINYSQHFEKINTLDSQKVFNKTKLDDLVEALSKEIYSENSTPLSTYYPDPETIKINISQIKTPGYIFLNQSYSKGWQVKVGDKKLNFSLVGPGYISIEIPGNLTSKEIILTHSWTIYQVISMYAVFSIIFAVFIYLFLTRNATHQN